MPATLQEARFWGAEPGGGERAVVAGVRVVVHADGSLAVAADRLPGSPSSVAPIPERLGGGFVYILGSQLWRSQTWLGDVAPIFTASSTIDRAFVGLDRIYLRLSPGSLAALDPRSGRLRELGPLPSAPHFGQLVALDAWRALVIADLRGALVTADAGASWHPVSLPLEPYEVVGLEDAFRVTAVDAGRHEQSWLVRANGRSEAFTEPPEDPSGSGLVGESNASFRRLFDEHPLAAAIEDGWPLRDDTAMVARDGALARVRLSDGALIDLTAGAFPLSPSRCHGISLSRPSEPGAFGFVCGEACGQTRIYAWDPNAAALSELRRFDDAREVIASGNGALVVGGGCKARTEMTADTAHAGTQQQAWCVMSSARTWSELRLRTDRPERIQPVVLTDGRVALLRPPTNGDLSTAHLSIEPPTGGQTAAEVAIQFGALERGAERVLRFGTWMNGFEERRPGVLGGWIDAGGSVLGVEIDIHGEARAGEYIRDAGAPVVSGRWAFGWTASRGGFESIDGGLTWTKELPLPEPIAEPRARTERACGPIGCIIAGWLRVGWGGRAKPPPVIPRPFRATAGLSTSRTLRFVCEPLAPRPPELTAAPDPAPGARSPPDAAPRATSSAIAIGSARAAGSDFPPFSGRAAPTLTASDVGITAEGSGNLERSMRFTPAVRLYVWGPSTGEWEALGRWQVRWDWPWGGWTDSRASAVVASPWHTLDSARRALTIGTGAPATVWSVVEGDDADHALLVARHGSTAELIVLEADRAPLPVQHDGEDAFPEPRSALRVGGRWFVATSQPQADPPATVLWTLDGSSAHELLRIPRAGFDSRPDTRLARRTDGRAIGVLAEGQPDLTQPVSLWVAPVDIESAAVSEPERIGPPGILERSGRVCTDAEAGGWEFDAPYPGAIELSRDDPQWSASLQMATARLRVARDSSCVERILGSVDPYGSAPSAALVESRDGAAPRSVRMGPLGAATSPSLQVSVFSARTRFPLRCWAR